MFSFIRLSIFLVFISMLTHSVMARQNPATSPAAKRTAKLKEGQAMKVTGKIHYYGTRYLLKGEGSQDGRWFILLENQILQNLLGNLRETASYQVEGDIFLFNKARYLLPRKVKQVSANNREQKQVSGLLASLWEMASQENEKLAESPTSPKRDKAAQNSRKTKKAGKKPAQQAAKKKKSVSAKGTVAKKKSASAKGTVAKKKSVSAKGTVAKKKKADKQRAKKQQNSEEED